MWMPISFKLGEVAGDDVERDRPRHAARAVLGRVDHRLADLELIGHAKLHAFGVERIVFGMVGCQVEPVRIAMGADEAVVADRALKFAHAAHAHERIDADQAVEAVRMLRHRIGDQPVRQVIAARQAGPAGFVRGKEAVADAGCVHAGDQFGERQAAHQRLVHLHLADEEAWAPARPAGERLRRPKIDHGIYGFDIVHQENPRAGADWR